MSKWRIDQVLAADAHGLRTESVQIMFLAALLTLANLVGHMDMYTLSTVAQDIAKEFDLDESEKLGKIGL